MYDLDLGQTFLGNNLKTIWLRGTRLSEITISDGCCPHLRTLKLESNENLTEVNSLPTTVKDIDIYNCGLLRNMSVIGGLENLQYLRLYYCRELEMLPSISKLASLKEFSQTAGNKVERIEGLQECTSLETLVIDGGKCWEVLGTKSSEHLQRLKNVHLVAKKRSTVLLCIEMIEKWSKEMIICTKASAEAGSLLKSLAFPNLPDVQFFAKEEYKKRIERLSDVKAMIVCYLIKCNSPTSLQIGPYDIYECSELEEGKWVWMGAFTQQWLRFFDGGQLPSPMNVRSMEEGKWLWKSKWEMEWEMVGIDNEGSVVQAFHSLLELLAA